MSDIFYYRWGGVGIYLQMGIVTDNRGHCYTVLHLWKRNL